MLLMVFFVHWFSLNQMFVITFLVSFATEIERTRQNIACFHRGLHSTKNLKRATGHLSPPTDNVRAWLEIPVVIMETLFPC